MTSDSIETVGHLVNPSGERLSDVAVGLIGASPALAALRQVLQVAPAGLATDLPRAAAEALKAALDVRLADVLVGAWNTRRSLLKYLDRKRYPPADVFEVPLSEHTVTSTHHPRVAVLLNEKPIGEVEFTLKLSLTVKSGVLRVRDGRIIGALAGRCRGKGSLNLGDAVLLESQTRDFALPGDISFGEGVPIRALTVTG